MVVDVGFAHVLRVGVGVRIMIVFDGWMIVFVGMGRRHVLPLTSVPEIVHHVRMFVGMNNPVMLVLHDLPLVTPPCAQGPARGNARHTWQMVAPAALAAELALGRLLLGLVPPRRLDQPLAAGT